MIRVLPADEPGAAKYLLEIDSHRLRSALTERGGHALDLTIAACTFDKTGKAMLQYDKASEANLNAEQYVAASHAATEILQITPRPDTARERLLVRDSASGRMGSVDVPKGKPQCPHLQVRAPPATKP